MRAGRLVAACQGALGEALRGMGMGLDVWVCRLGDLSSMSLLLARPPLCSFMNVVEAPPPARLSGE